MMKAKLLHAGVVLELLLSGCATQPSQPVQVIQPPAPIVVEAPPSSEQKSAVWRGVLEDSRQCVEQVYNQPDAGPIRAHRPLNILAATRAQRNNRSRISAAEIQALNAMVPRLRACRHQFRDAMEAAKPSAVPIFDNQVRKSDRNLQALIQRKETWGDYVRQEQADARHNQKAVDTDGQPLFSAPARP